MKGSQKKNANFSKDQTNNVNHAKTLQKKHQFYQKITKTIQVLRIAKDKRL